MYDIYVWINLSNRWYETGLPPKTTEVEANEQAKERSASKAGHIYAVIEDGRDIPHTVFWNGHEFRRSLESNLRVHSLAYSDYP